jgi:hypothetical protein
MDTGVKMTDKYPIYRVLEELQRAHFGHSEFKHVLENSRRTMEVKEDSYHTGHSDGFLSGLTYAINTIKQEILK